MPAPTIDKVIRLPDGVYRVSRDLALNQDRWEFGFIQSNGSFHVQGWTRAEHEEFARGQAAKLDGFGKPAVRFLTAPQTA